MICIMQRALETSNCHGSSEASTVFQTMTFYFGVLDSVQWIRKKESFNTKK